MARTLNRKTFSGIYMNINSLRKYKLSLPILIRMRKKLMYLLVFIFSVSAGLSSLNCNGSKYKFKNSDSAERKWTYFKILADSYDSPIFVKLQDDLGIDPKLERYTIVVNIASQDPGQQYVLFGDEESSNPPRFPWSRLSKEVQNGLINWTGDNKFNLQ
jgi:hypothetical protein